MCRAEGFLRPSTVGVAEIRNALPSRSTSLDLGAFLEGCPPRAIPVRILAALFSRQGPRRNRSCSSRRQASARGRGRRSCRRSTHRYSASYLVDRLRQAALRRPRAGLSIPRSLPAPSRHQQLTPRERHQRHRHVSHPRRPDRLIATARFSEAVSPACPAAWSPFAHKPEPSWRRRSTFCQTWRRLDPMRRSQGRRSHRKFEPLW